MHEEARLFIRFPVTSDRVRADGTLDGRRFAIVPLTLSHRLTALRNSKEKRSELRHRLLRCSRQTTRSRPLPFPGRQLAFAPVRSTPEPQREVRQNLPESIQGARAKDLRRTLCRTTQTLRQQYGPILCPPPNPTLCYWMLADRV
jgi:hypothetical protein